MAGWEAVIGLEVHAQLRTRSKIFCGCPAAHGAAPNTATCPVCLGHPGALPVLNEAAVKLAVRAALALGCTVAPRSAFARKHYFYPDLPKGYQITQCAEPLASGGGVPIEVGGQTRVVGLERVHLEEDAGKSIHEGMPDSDRASYVDLNRAGIPLLEIVSRPEIRTPEEAFFFLQRLRSTLRFTEVCDGNLEEGSLRCDANVSIRPLGDGALGARTELKNLNSFRNVERALEFEIRRQITLVEDGGAIEQRTALWNAAAGRTRVLRGKEEAHDYRYFPEPDLPPIELHPSDIEAIRAGIPELPAERKRRFVETLGLRSADAHRLTLEKPVADYFENVAARCGNPAAAAAFVLNDALRGQRAARGRDAPIPVPAEHLAELIALVDAGELSLTAARSLVGELRSGGKTPRELIVERGLGLVRDADALRAAVRTVIEAHPAEAAKLRGGKTRLFEFFVGRAMRATDGRADPAVIRGLLEELLR